MDSRQLIDHAKRLAQLNMNARDDYFNSRGSFAQSCEFLRMYAGEKSSFLNSALEVSARVTKERAQTMSSILLSFADYIEAGLKDEIPPIRQAQIDVVSDLLEQANKLLEDSAVHGAAPAVLIGATLEEFLRTWVEKEGLSVENMKHSIDAYARVLKEADLIDKQDIKDITAWAGIRNDAAHGHWQKVESKEKISLVLQGVNLFLRKHQK